MRLRDDSWSDEQHRNALVAVKEHLNTVDKNRENVDLLLDRTGAALGYLKAQGVNIGPLEAQLGLAQTSWTETLKEVPTVVTKITPLIKQQGAKTKGDITTYEKGVTAYLEELDGAAFKTFSTGAGAAIEMLANMSKMHDAEKARCEEMVHLATMFECPKEMATSTEMIAKAGEMLDMYKALWKAAQECQMMMEEACQMLWTDLNPEGLEDNAKLLVGNVKKLPKSVKDSDAYLGLDRSAKEFLSTCPLIGSLRQPAMRERHWDELMDVTKK